MEVEAIYPLDTELVYLQGRQSPKERNLQRRISCHQTLSKRHTAGHNYRVSLFEIDVHLYHKHLSRLMEKPFGESVLPSLGHTMMVRILLILSRD